MKYDDFRRSDNVEDYRDTKKPVDSAFDLVFSCIAEIIKLCNSKLAKDAGRDDIKP